MIYLLTPFLEDKIEKGSKIMHKKSSFKSRKFPLEEKTLILGKSR